MRFGIKTAPQDTTWQAMLDVWREADGIDVFESAWNFDHFYPIFADPTGPCLEAWTMLAAMAQATTRIRIGCQVTGMIYRHPAVLANMAATVDIVSNGRLIIGLGAGWNQEECDAYGIHLPPLKERFDRFDEGTEALVRLLSDTVTTFDGRYVQLRDARCEPKPVQRPHPPIAIGGNGEKRTLRTVARFAQHWNAIASDTAAWQAKRDVLLRHCADLGRNPAEIEPRSTSATTRRCPHRRSPTLLPVGPRPVSTSPSSTSPHRTTRRCSLRSLTPCAPPGWPDAHLGHQVHSNDGVVAAHWAA
jgi:F420-dependent oxidoreductase-like protein